MRKNSRITVSFLIRNNELPYTEVGVTEETEPGKVQKAPFKYQGFNCIDPSAILGLKISGYKLVQHGGQFFFSVTLTDRKKSIPGCRAARTLLSNLMTDKNRWETIVYHNIDGTIGVASRERKNTIRPNGQSVKRKAVTTEYLS